jgi:lycopene cyclase domain-containing protein
MSYFGFLLIFLVGPILVLTMPLCGGRANVVHTSIGRDSGALRWAIVIQGLLAVLYTTPWDNYLVATGVWHYRQGAVTGVLLGYVPLEEYAFFVLEAILVGVWWNFVGRRVVTHEPFRPSIRLRVWACASMVALWLASVAILLSQWGPGTYLVLILAWALPSVLIQIAFGADILWHHRRLIAAVIVPLGIYLSLADAMAIAAGIWTIDPSQSTGIFLGRLPVEEAVFFLVTVILLAFGLTLSLAEESRSRFGAALARTRQHSMPPENRAIK